VAYALIGSPLTAAAAVGGGTFTSGTYDTTGADEIFVVMSSYGGATRPVLTDSKSNAWNPDVDQLDGVSITRCTLWSSKPTSVGSGQTWTVTQAGSFASIIVYAFSGSSATTPFDQSNKSFTNAGTSVTTGSVTPNTSNQILMAGLSLYIDNTGLAGPSGYSTPNIVTGVGGSHLACAGAYLIQTSIAASNPKWTWTNSAQASAVVGTYKSANTNPPRMFLVM